MFVDASALVAILCREAGYERVADRLRRGSQRLTSGMAVFEAVLAVARIKSVPPDAAEHLVNGFRAAADIALISLGAAETRAAIAAHNRFGKGCGHPARLNFGDCFAYSCARVHDVPLLFVGKDFSRTDIRPALI